MGINSLYWGNTRWLDLHFTALTYPKNPKQTDKSTYLLWILLWIETLMCEICKNNAKVLLYEKGLMPTDYDLSNQQTFLFWTIKFHNAVNQELGKRILTNEEAIQKINEALINNKNNAIPGTKNPINKCDHCPNISELPCLDYVSQFINNFDSNEFNNFDSNENIEECSNSCSLIQENDNEENNISDNNNNSDMANSNNLPPGVTETTVSTSRSPWYWALIIIGIILLFLIIAMIIYFLTRRKKTPATTTSTTTTETQNQGQTLDNKLSEFSNVNALDTELNSILNNPIY